MTDGALLAESNQTPCVWRGNSSPPVKDFTRHNKKARSHSRRVMDTKSVHIANLLWERACSRSVPS